jgi:sulfopropanediol 3-dehydrogenase
MRFSQAYRAFIAFSCLYLNRVGVFGCKYEKRSDIINECGAQYGDMDIGRQTMRIVKNGGHRLFEEDRETSAIVSEMLFNLEKNGMDAVRMYSEKFDGWNPASFELSGEEIDKAISELDKQVVLDTDYCQDNVRRFAREQLKTMLPLEVETRPGVVLGHKHIPVGAVGSYIPGGRYPMFGSAQMSIIPAKVAGVKTVLACTPPVKGLGYYPATINAMKKAGADRLFVLGGVPALALMAFGLGDVQPVDVLCGAGNKFVAEAKRQLFGRCGIDLLAGPTEILIIADDEADPSLVACDLLGQAEHDPNSGICLICLSEDFAKQTIAEVEKQLETLPTADVASVSWANNGIVYVADDKAEAVKLSDDYAPEHLELHVADTDYYFGALTNYGSLFIGEETTVAYGDKSIGTNHILPTSRAARYTGGVWVGKFLKTCTYQRMTPEASREVGEVTERQCNIERMLAHGITAAVRVKRYSGD